MKLKISKTLADAIGCSKLVAFGCSEDKWRWADRADIDIGRMEAKQVERLNELLLAHKAIRGVGVLLTDIATWRTALSDPLKTRARSVEQFERLLYKALINVPGRRIYQQDQSGVWLCSYVNKIVYHPPRKDRDGYSPPLVTVELIYEYFGKLTTDTLTFTESDCRNIMAADALTRKSIYRETPELRQHYLAELERYSMTIPAIGRQYLASGVAYDDMDGNPKSRDEHWYWRNTHTINMAGDGEPSRVVVDVFKEGDEDEGHRYGRSEAHLDKWFWQHKLQRDDEGDDAANDRDSDEEPPEIEVPVHPYIAVFDLRRHLRLRIHVGNVTEYKYDTKLADKLVLPQDMKDLIEMLIERRSSFQDIVAGKSGGAVVLLCGPPGTGKTLTAEVYAESECRALYSVQASQLGTDPEALEDQLLKIFARATRWQAVMLLDEADVYVRERGGNLQQNAIVGVFLRVLEYHSSILFLTTNRPEDVDDAIASRCMARLTYPAPSPEDQAKIWKILAATAGIQLDDVDEIVAANPGLTGRDVKNLLKLGHLVSSATNRPVDARTIDYVRKFKPTTTDEEGD